jgi:hypothetical protein
LGFRDFGLDFWDSSKKIKKVWISYRHPIFGTADKFSNDLRIEFKYLYCLTESLIGF